MMSETNNSKSGVVTLILGVITVALGITSVFLSAYLVTETKSSVKNVDLEKKIKIECNVLIIGSGFAGSYAAYQLAPRHNGTLCLVERLDRDGGRVHDISEYPNGPVFGTGALRITNRQATMKTLADELGVEFELADSDVELLKVRGRNFYRGGAVHRNETNRMCQELFSTMNCSNEDTPTDEMLFERLTILREKSPELISKHPDFPTLLLSLFGAEGLAFMRETGFHSLFTSIANHAALDYIATEGSDSIRYYPVGGMSEYIKRMIGKAREAGLRLYRSEPVLSIATTASGKFVVETATFSIAAEKVLCSIDPVGFTSVRGNVAESVKSALEFRGIAPKTAVTVTAWWSERWWEESVLAKANLSNVVSHGNCFNGMIMPSCPYGRDQNVTRVVYDDGACVETWRTLISSGDSEKLTNEVVNSLQHVFSDVQVPRPRTLQGFVHDNAWHFQDSRSTKTNKEVFEWSLRPVPYANFALIGEAYNLNFSGWCDAALKSTMTVLTEFYNFTYPCQNDEGSPAICPQNKIRKGQERLNFRFSLP